MEKKTYRERRAERSAAKEARKAEKALEKERREDAKSRGMVIDKEVKTFLRRKTQQWTRFVVIQIPT